ncbi:DUF1918 domain-containing protein [Streptomyces sp. I5]|uniref:DUF1918 domain-containing protein n=1 Tax=Streptomyces sp. I5 TaxID=2759947 RepID=UPI0027DE5F50|nr:DUF1918 domain-containing protein [Streptomyces sp. I5]
MAGLTARSQGYAPVEPCGGVPPVARWIQHHSEERAAVMRAHPGDRPVVGSPATGVVGCDGGIVGPHHDDGTPPYDVRRSDTDDITLVCPGPDAYIRHLDTEHGHADAVDRPSAPRPVPEEQTPGDIGRRLAVTRRRCVLSRQETAHRAHRRRHGDPAPRGSPPGLPTPSREQAAHAMTGRRSRPRTSQASASLPPTSRHTRAPVREGWPR